MSIYDYTPREIYLSFYSDDDMSSITQQAKQVLQKVAYSKSNLEEGKRYCLRGLEGQTRIGLMAKKRNRFDARQAVFEEQERQWDEEKEIFDPQAIANAYQNVTASCQIWAQAVGNHDRKVVESYLFDEKEEEASEEIALSSSSHHSKLESPDTRIRRRVGDTLNHFQPMARAA